ncbi:zf-CCHC domain-containing protein [Tanacetum coccineum]
MVLYNALPKKEYERIFMCKTTKDIWQSLLITHQESIDSGFARFNTIITSLEALDEGVSSKNYVRKFLRALHPKWRANVTAIEESKDLSSLGLDELIGNLKVHEVVMEKDSEIFKGKKERAKFIALKAKKESSDDETSTFESDDEEYAMAVRNFKKFLEERVNLLGNQVKKRSHSDKGMRKKGRVTENALDAVIQIISLAIVQNQLATKIKRPSLEVLGAIARNKYQKAFVGGCWSDSENEVEDKTNDVTCLMAQSSNEVTLDSSHYSDDASSFDDDRDESTIKADGSTVPGSVDPSTSQKVAEHVFSPPLSSRSDFNIVRKKLIHDSIEKSKRPPLKSSLKNGLGYVKTDRMNGLKRAVAPTYDRKQNSILYLQSIQHSVSQICDNKCKVLFMEDGSEIIKDDKIIEHKNVNEALGDESWVVAMQEELNQFVANDVWVPLPKNQSIIGTKWVHRNKLDENGIVSRNKARLVAQRYNQQEGIDYDETYASLARLDSI